MILGRKIDYYFEGMAHRDCLFEMFFAVLSFSWTLEIALLVSFLRTNKFQQMYWDVYQSGRNRSKKQKSLSFNAVDYIPHLWYYYYIQWQWLNMHEEVNNLIK